MPHDTQNFKVSEFGCKCCGENRIDQRVIDIAQAIRDELGVPVRVNSGYRCATHNRNVGGVKGSRHTKGLAADLSCKVGALKLYDTVRKLWDEGRIPELGYCIRYTRLNFVHIDVEKRKRGNMWEVRA